MTKYNMEVSMDKKIRNIIFDFDGVIIDSMPIRTEGFKQIFRKYNIELVEELIKYHEYNAGLSRFHKIKYFYNELLKKEISEEKINEYASEFSKIMKEKLTFKDILINDTINFIESNYTNYNFHIASGSEETELQFICSKLGIAGYFKSIKGSPIHKNDLVKAIIEEYEYVLEETILIGDSINDFEAAVVNNISFYGYNNIKLVDKGENYIDSFECIFKN